MPERGQTHENYQYQQCSNMKSEVRCFVVKSGQMLSVIPQGADQTQGVTDDERPSTEKQPGSRLEELFVSHFAGPFITSWRAAITGATGTSSLTCGKPPV